MRRLVTALTRDLVCAPALLDRAADDADRLEMAAGCTGAAGARVENGTGVVGLRPDAPGMARHDRTGRAPLPVEPTAKSAATSRSRPRSSCFRERRPTNTASFSAARTSTRQRCRTTRLRAAPGWTGGVLRRRGGQSTAAGRLAAPRGDPAGKAGGRPVKNVLKVDVDPANVTLWVNAAKVLSRPARRRPRSTAGSASASART